MVVGDRALASEGGGETVKGASLKLKGRGLQNSLHEGGGMSKAEEGGQPDFLV